MNEPHARRGHVPERSQVAVSPQAPNQSHQVSKWLLHVQAASCEGTGQHPPVTTVSLMGRADAISVMRTDQCAVRAPFEAKTVYSLTQEAHVTKAGDSQLLLAGDHSLKVFIRGSARMCAKYHFAHCSSMWHLQRNLKMLASNRDQASIWAT